MTYEIDDDVYPGTAVIYIEARWGNQWASGTGFLVGRNDLLTAAHVIFNYERGGLADEIRLYGSFDPDDFGEIPISWEYAQYFPDFDPDGDGRVLPGDFFAPTLSGSELDIALLSLTEPIGDQLGWFGIDPNFYGGSVGVIGHPGNYGLNMMYDSGTIQASSVDGVYYVGSDLEINHGNSGGPIYYDYGGGPYAVGIVSTGIAATAIGAHFYWLEESLAANDYLIDAGQIVLWNSQAESVALVAATYEFFTDRIPTAEGFEYLISSTANLYDLNDPYYAGFNLENRYINFASNLGTAGEGVAYFNVEFGNLSFSDAVKVAYSDVMGQALTGAALQFFLTGQGFYQSVAAERVVRPGVDLEDATKIVAIGSILNEAIKSGQGPYADAIEALVADVAPDANSFALGGDLFAIG
ncbi:MAG: trypsin-like peptidase domain-containing protein [Planctomycetales bacterium]|nr:trypsin-like peptidase domain-containing protein [Planctomycetales bacterium]